MESDGDIGPTLDVRNNGRQKILFLGKTGSGKSALCNALSQSKWFLESANADIGNTSTMIANVNYIYNYSNKELPGYLRLCCFGGKCREEPRSTAIKEVSFIDTVGFDSIDKSPSQIAEFIAKLKHSCDFITLIVVVLKAPTRLEESLKETIHLFETMFEKNRFWQNTVFVISHRGQSDKEIQKREKNSISDDELIKNLQDQMKKTFSLEMTEGPPMLIIDTYYNADKHNEKSRFDDSANELLGMLTEEGKSKINADTIEKAFSDNEKIMKELKKKDAEIKRLVEEVENLKQEKVKNDEEIAKAEKKEINFEEMEKKCREKSDRLRDEVKKCIASGNHEKAKDLDEQANQSDEKAEEFREKKKRAKAEATKLRYNGYLIDALLVIFAIGGYAALHFLKNPSAKYFIGIFEGTIVKKLLERNLHTLELVKENIKKKLEELGCVLSPAIFEQFWQNLEGKMKQEEQKKIE